MQPYERVLIKDQYVGSSILGMPWTFFLSFWQWRPQLVLLLLLQLFLLLLLLLLNHNRPCSKLYCKICSCKDNEECSLKIRQERWWALLMLWFDDSNNNNSNSGSKGQGGVGGVVANTYTSSWGVVGFAKRLQSNFFIRCSQCSIIAVEMKI